MMRSLTAMMLAVAWTASAFADEPTSETQPTNPRKVEPVLTELPEEIRNFNGMIVGRLVRKDVERGTFDVAVDAIPRVWQNSKARNPKSIVGKTITIDGVFGKWLDVLLVLRNGETLEFEARHDGKESLTFPGELLRKVAPFNPADYPELPEDFRGFEGSLTGTIQKKDPETFELIVEVEKVLEASNKSRAEHPRSIEGHRMMLAGFWQRKDEYHSLKTGQRIQFNVRHIGLRSDHVSIQGALKTLGAKQDAPAASPSEPSGASTGSESGFPAGMRGFRGIMIGELVSKDIEKGEFVFRAERVTRVWKQNKAADTDSCKGRRFAVRGVQGRFLDVLLSAQPGDTLEVEAFHNRGDALDFPGELLKKVEKE